MKNKSKFLRLDKRKERVATTPLTTNDHRLLAIIRELGGASKNEKDGKK